MDRRDELRFLFSSTQKTEKITADRMISLLYSADLKLDADETRAVREAFERGGGFSVGDFASIAESLGYSKYAKTKTENAIRSLVPVPLQNQEHEDDNEVQISFRSIRHYLSLSGKSIGLSSQQVESFMVHKFGMKTILDRSQVTLEEALHILNS